MKKGNILILILVVLISFITSCEKDEDRVIILDEPVPPSLTVVPDLTMSRANASNNIIFKGTPLNPGFVASVNYFLEASATGNNFVNAIQLYNGTQVDSMVFAVSDINGLLLRLFPADQTSSVDLRIRAVMVVDAGTGAPGSGSNPMVYLSPTVTAELTLFGLPRLDLVNSGIVQSVESPLGDGVYSGFVKLDPSVAFTLKDPDTDVEYGNDGGNLAVNGSGITAPSTLGWYQINVDVNTLTYSLEPYMIGLVGSATPNGWDAPDQKMDYHAQSGTWRITIDLIDGEVKFRKNDGWAWNIGGAVDNLVQGGDNIALGAGNYTFILTIINDQTGSVVVTKN